MFELSAHVERVALGGSRKRIKALSGGIFEMKIAFGPGYRVYYGENKNTLVLLLGGDKDSQFRDITEARKFWRAYAQK